MAHGAPDDSNVVNTVDLYRVDDMAELAARMGSIMSFLRSGKVLYLEDFERGLSAWTVTEVDADSDVTLSNDRVFMGKAGVYFASGTGTYHYAQINKLLPAPQVCKVGLAGHFSVVTGAKYYYFYVSYGDGSKIYAFCVRYDHTVGKLAYYHHDDAYTEFATPGVLYHAANNFHVFKMVFDLVTLEYDRLYLDRIEYAMTDLEPEYQGTELLPFLSVVIKVEGDGTDQTELYLDNLVLTFDEF